MESQTSSGIAMPSEQAYRNLQRQGEAARCRSRVAFPGFGAGALGNETNAASTCFAMAARRICHWALALEFLFRLQLGLVLGSRAFLFFDLRLSR
jgi:hypothetical protein